MNRKIIKEDILNKINLIRSNILDVIFRIIIIVGFFGEIEDDFK